MTHLPLSQGRNSNAVINVSTVELRFGTWVLLKKAEFEVAHEQTSVAWPHFGAHSDTFLLSVEMTIKLESVKVKYQLSKAEKGLSGRVKRGALSQEEPER